MKTHPSGWHLRGVSLTDINCHLREERKPKEKRWMRLCYASIHLQIDSAGSSLRVDATVYTEREREHHLGAELLVSMHSIYSLGSLFDSNSFWDQQSANSVGDPMRIQKKKKRGKKAPVSVSPSKNHRHHTCE